MKTIISPMQAVSAFFEAYARALEHYDTKSIAYLYNIPCSFLADDTTTVFNDMSRLEGFFNTGAGFYRQFGIAHVRHELWSRREWTEKIINVKVNWRYMDVFNNPIYSCDYQYILKLDKHDQWKIVMSVSLNEKQHMEEWRRNSTMAH